MSPPFLTIIEIEDILLCLRLPCLRFQVTERIQCLGRRPNLRLGLDRPRFRVRETEVLKYQTVVSEVRMSLRL